MWWPWKRRHPLDGILYSDSKVTVIQRPPMHRTVLYGDREFYILFPYVQLYVYQVPIIKNVRRLSNFAAMRASLSGEPVTKSSDMVYGFPWNSDPMYTYCMGNFSPPRLAKKDLVVRAAINHFWQSQFTAATLMSEMQYMTKMGYSYLRIFNEIRPKVVGHPFHLVAQLPIGVGLNQWNELLESEPASS